MLYTITEKRSDGDIYMSAVPDKSLVGFFLQEIYGSSANKKDMAAAKKMAASLKKNLYLEAGESEYHGMHISLDDLCRYAGREVFEAMLPEMLTARHVSGFIKKADPDVLAELRRALMYERPVPPPTPPPVPSEPKSDNQP